jgi:uncharacterized protein YbcV (DUF1398 family)
MTPLTESLLQEAMERSAGKTYPEYVQNLRSIGVASYEVTVSNHDRVFRSDEGQQLVLRGSGVDLVCALSFLEKEVKAAVLRTQQGLTGYPEFLSEIAAAGVHSYTADLAGRKVTYKGRNAEDSYEEGIPSF